MLIIFVVILTDCPLCCLFSCHDASKCCLFSCHAASMCYLFSFHDASMCCLFPCHDASACCPFSCHDVNMCYLFSCHDASMCLFSCHDVSMCCLFSSQNASVSVSCHDASVCYMMLSLWLSSSMAAHFAFCFLSVCIIVLFWSCSRRQRWCFARVKLACSTPLPPPPTHTQTHSSSTPYPPLRRKFFLLTEPRRFLCCSSLFRWCVGGFTCGVYFVIICFSSFFAQCCIHCNIVFTVRVPEVRRFVVFPVNRAKHSLLILHDRTQKINDVVISDSLRKKGLFCYMRTAKAQISPDQSCASTQPSLFVSYFSVSVYFLYWQRRSRSDCANAQSDLGLRCLHIVQCHFSCAENWTKSGLAAHANSETNVRILGKELSRL